MTRLSVLTDVVVTKFTVPVDGFTVGIALTPREWLVGIAWLAGDGGGRRVSVRLIPCVEITLRWRGRTEAMRAALEAAR